MKVILTKSKPSINFEKSNIRTQNGRNYEWLCLNNEESHERFSDTI